METTKKPQSVDDYISGFPLSVQEKLKEMRKIIKKNAPDAEEKISYGMPAYTQKGMLVYFAAHKNHIGFYPVSTAIEAFSKELTGYKRSKGTIQFPLDKPLPLSLIGKITAFRVSENSMKAGLKIKI